MKRIGVLVIACLIVAGLSAPFVLIARICLGPLPSPAPTALVPRSIIFEGRADASAPWVVCKDRWMASTEDECPDVRARRFCEERDAGHAPVWCMRPRGDAGVLTSTDESVLLGHMDACETFDEWKDTVDGVPMAVWKARCTLWIRGEYSFRDAGAQ